MPLRHQVPTLKLLSIRVISRPDGIDRVEGYPNESSLRREKSISKCLRRRGTAALKLKSGTYLENTGCVGTNIIELIVNAWIRLSNFHQTHLNEIHQMKYFLGISNGSIETLDFLFEGFLLRSGKHVLDVGGLIPYTFSPRKIHPFTWQEIVTTLCVTKADIKLKNLYIYFCGASPIADVTVFRFAKTFQGFSNLKKLVVHGDGNDDLMEAVGRNCFILQYLDIRHTQVTEKGVLRLLFRDPTECKKFKANDIEFIFPEGVLNPLTDTLEYLDISTVPYRGLLLDHNRSVLYACHKLVQTPRRFFFYPGGTLRMYTEMDLKLIDFKSRVLTCVRTTLIDLFIDICRSFWPCLTQGFTHVDSRVNLEGEEISFNMYNLDYLVIHMKLESLIIVNLIVYSINACDFIPIDMLQFLLPNLQHLKASLKGAVTNERSFLHLLTVTIPIVHTKNTLVSILRNCTALQYIEVRELYLATDLLTDKDVAQMFCSPPENLEIIRFTFQTGITFSGVKTFFLFCPQLRVIGDLKNWDTALATLVRLKLSMNIHNFDVMFEYDGIVYSTRKPCHELYN